MPPDQTPYGGQPVPKSAAPLTDVVFRAACQLAATLVVLVAVALVVVLLIHSAPILSKFGQFLTGTDLNPSRGRYGALAYIYGTLLTSFLAMLMAVPLGVGAAAYLAEIAPGPVRRVGSFFVELLAAIPSVVYGFWGLFFVAPVIQWFFNRVGGPNTSGAGILAASVILAIMIVPYITAISFDVCRAVPRSSREGALALGATRWQMIWTSVLPAARPGIVAACFLALGRALGETMAVTMLIGNRPELPQSFRDVLHIPFALGDSIASVIANQLNESVDETHRASLVALGLLLLLVTVVVNVAARLLLARIGQGSGRPGLVRRGLGAIGAALRTSRDVAPAPVGIDPERAVRVARRNRLFDRVMTRLLASCLFLTAVPLFLILGYILYRGVGAVNWAFFTELPAPPFPIRHPDGTIEPVQGGMAHALGGSALLVGLATLFAVPLAIATAISLAEYRNTRWSHIVRFVAELLAGVPSIVIGIFAYAVVVRTTGSFSGWAGAFALGIMMIPIVVRSTEESLKLVPTSMRHASYALGAKEWQTVSLVTLPAALPAIVTGVFLAIGRIAGETAPLLLTAYGSNFWPRSPGDRTPFLPKYIYNYSTSGIPDWERQAWAAALVLLVVVMSLNVGIRLLAGRRVIAASRAE